MENIKTLNESIISIRVALQNAKLKKTGKNSFAKFDYFELSDFLPRLNELMKEENMNDLFSIEENNNGTMVAKLTLIKGSEKQEYTIPFTLFETPVNIKKDNDTGEIREVKSMQDIQYLGALNTYYKRYLYINAFGITDGDIIDAIDNTSVESKKKNLTASPKQVDMLSKVYVGDNLTKLLELNGIDKLEDMPITKASELIKNIMDKKNKENK